MTKNVLYWALLASLALTGRTLHAETFEGRVVSVADGDTIGVRSRGRYSILRLYGIDTPESKQLDGPQATAFTRKFSMGKWARVKVVDQDRYGRLVALVYINGKCLNEALLAAGWAWHYKRFSRSPKFAALERQARLARRGIWRRTSPTPPWVWRYRNYRQQRWRRGSRYRRWSRRTPRNYRSYRYRRNDRDDDDDRDNDRDDDDDRDNDGRGRRSDRYRHSRRGPTTPPPRVGKQPPAHAPKSGRVVFLGNVISGVYHAPSCPDYRCKNCLRQLSSHAEAQKSGFRPHHTCVHAKKPSK